MTELIAQEELDALFAAVEVADRHRRPGAEAATAALYDFRYATKLSPDHLRLLHARVNILAGVLERTLSLYLNTTVELRAPSVDVLSSEQYLRNLSDLPLLSVVHFPGGLTSALWEISAGPAYTALDCMLGGSGDRLPPLTAEATPLQRAILRRLFAEILSAWTELWPRLRELEPEVTDVVCSTGAVDLRATEERLFCVALELTVGPTTGQLRLCLPLVVAKRLLREEKNTVRPADLQAQDALSGAELLTAAPLPVVAYLEPASLTLRRLLEMQPGDVLDLREPATENFRVSVSGVAKFQAQAGTVGGKVAIQLLTSTDH